MTFHYTSVTFVLFLCCASLTAFRVVNTLNPSCKFCTGVKKCLPQSMFCDGKDDCGDNSDEADCDEQQISQEPTNSNSEADYPRVVNILNPSCKFCTGVKKCLPQSMFCDGKDDCGDNSDETDCDEQQTEATPFGCDSLQQKCPGVDECTWKWDFCDTWSDCSDGSDEWYC